MENRDKILIAILVIIICALTCAIFISLSNSISYERIELVPNGTSIEIPTSCQSFDTLDELFDLLRKRKKNVA